MAKISWFLSRQGFMVSRIFALGSATAISTSYLFMHGQLLHKYKELVQLYSSGVGKELPPNTREIAEQARSECKLEDADKSTVDFFPVCGHEMFHAGSTHLKGGAIIGLPETFNYSNKTDIEKGKMKLLGDKPIDWNSKAGNDLLESLILSRDAKKFAIAREIHHCTTGYVYAYSLSVPLCLLASYVMGNRIAFRYNMYRLPRMVRVILYSLCGSIGLFTYLMVKDGFSQYWDGYADRMAAETSPEYLSGGIEFYEKSLKRNVAFRKLIGKYGENFYTWHGNNNYYVRTPNLPLTARLDKLKQMKAESNFDEHLAAEQQ